MKTKQQADVAPAQCGQHISLPWKAEDLVVTAHDGLISVCEVHDHSDTSMEHTEQEAQANAAFIVRACNAHDQLVEALTDIAGMAETGRESVNECITAIRQVDVDAAAAVTRGCFLSIGNKARAALAQAQKEAL